MVDQLTPASATTPTRNPASVMTQSPTSTPWAVPLLTVSILDQLDASCLTTRADSQWRSRRWRRSSSSSRRRTFSSRSALA